MNIKKLAVSLFIGSNISLFKSFVESVWEQFVIHPLIGHFVGPEFPVLNVSLMADNTTLLNDINMEIGEFEFQRLKEIATFIKEIQKEEKSLLDRPQYLMLDESPIFYHNAYAIKEHGNYYIAFGRALRESSEYSIEELKSITAHELGHILRNHLEITSYFIRFLNCVSGFSIFTILSGTAEILDLLTAFYLREQERQANSEAVRIYPNPCGYINAFQKLEKNKEDIPLSSLEQYISNFYTFLKRLYPLPEEYISDHPSVNETISFFKQHLADKNCEVHTEETVCYKAT